MDTKQLTRADAFDLSVAMSAFLAGDANLCERYLTQICERSVGDTLELETPNATLQITIWTHEQEEAESDEYN